MMKMRNLLLTCLMINAYGIFAQQLSNWNQLKAISYQRIISANNNKVGITWDSKMDSFLCNGLPVLYSLTPQINDVKVYFLVLDEQEEIVFSHEWRSENESVVNRDLAQDANGNFYLAMGVNAPKLFLNEELVYTTNGSSQILITKISPTGIPLYIQGYPYSHVASVMLYPLPDGKLVMAGTTSYVDIDLGPFTLPCTGCHLHDSDVYIAILDSIGQVLNARRFGSDSWDYVHDVVVSQSGDIYLTGSYYKSFTLDSVQFMHLGWSTSSADAYLAKFDTALKLQWMLPAQNTANELGLHLAKDVSGNVIWGVEYTGNQITIGDTTVTGSAQNVLVSRVSPDGTIAWVQNVGGNTNTLRLTDLAIDQHNNLWTSILFTGHLMYAGTSLTAPQSSETWETALLGMNAAQGTPLANLFLTGNVSDLIYHLSSSNNNDLILAGFYDSDSCSMLNMTLTDGEQYVKPFFYAQLEYPPVSSKEPSLLPVPITAQPNPVSAAQPLTLQLPAEAHGELRFYTPTGQLYARSPLPPGETTLTLPAGYFRPGVYFAAGRSREGRLFSSRIVVH